MIMLLEFNIFLDLFIFLFCFVFCLLCDCFFSIPEKSRFTYAPTMSVCSPFSISFKKACGGERRVRRNIFGILHVCCLIGCWAWLKSDWLDVHTVGCFDPLSRLSAPPSLAPPTLITWHHVCRASMQMKKVVKKHHTFRK